jgi:hypothetical protein
MNQRLLTCFVFALLYTPDRALAQFNDARAYDNTAVGMNQLELSYARVARQFLIRSIAHHC